MQRSYDVLIDNNRRWAEAMRQQDPQFFERLAEGQSPEYCWIGCSDSRVPETQITGTLPGQIFVHRNVGNVIIQTDMNLLSCLYFAVEILRVKHVILCGHYRCAGISEAMGHKDLGFVNNWLRSIKEVYAKHRSELEAIGEPERRHDRLVELNVIEQVHNLAKTRIVQRAWKDRTLQIHGWVYDFRDGLITDLEASKSEIGDLDPIYRYDL